MATLRIRALQPARTQTWPHGPIIQQACTSQLTHTLQRQELMERDGVPDQLRLATLFHDSGRLAPLHGERPEHVEGRGRPPIGSHEPGVGLDRSLPTSRQYQSPKAPRRRSPSHP